MSLRHLSVLVFIAVLCQAQSGVINTVIGTGVAGMSGDGGPGANAQLNTPNGVAVDTAGNVYIADYANSRIRKLLTSDFTQTIAGCGLPPACLDQSEGRLAGSTAIYSPWDVVVDTAGNFYFTDSGLHRIRKVSPSGILTNYAGSGAPGVSSSGFTGDGGPATAAKLNNPVGLAVDGQGNIYFADP
jgi:streptogramin lyase